MTDEDTHSVIINISRPRVLYKESNHIIKNKETKRKHIKNKLQPKTYLLPPLTVIKPLSVTSTVKDEIFLPYLRYSKKQEQDRFREKLQLGICEDYKIAYTELRKRLHTDDPVDDSRGVTDYDPTFFACIKGSTLSSYIAPYKSLKYLFNSQLRLRQEVGYRRDCMLNLETHFNREQKVYDSTVDRCLEQIKYLDEFISDDYRKSMTFLSKWEKLKTAVNNKVYDLQCLAAQKFTLTSKIVGLNYRYGLQQKYGRFLYYLSPPSWRLKNRNFARSVEIEARGFDLGMSSEEDTFNVIFEKLKTECDGGLVKPALYFQHHNDIMKIFDGIEQQHLHHFTHVARLAPHASFLKKGIKLFKDIIAQDSAGIITEIKEFEKMLLFCEEQSLQLQDKFFKILNTSFYETVGAPDVLKFQFHLEFCYAKVYNEKPMNLGVMGTAKALENFYMEYTRLLESVIAKNIKKAIKQSVETERTKFKNAKLAAKELRLFERLERALLRACAPVAQNQPPPPVNQAKVISQPRTKLLQRKTSSKQIHDNQKRLTETEIEYLSLFTDWTEKEDPAHYLRRLSSFGN